MDYNENYEDVINSIITKFRQESISDIHISVLKSAIQKYIRRSMFKKCLWSASRLDMFRYVQNGERIRTNFLHRLMIIYLEDVGFCGLHLWELINKLIYENCIVKRKNKDVKKEIQSIRYALSLLCDKNQYKVRACSYLNTFMSNTIDVNKFIEQTIYKNIEPTTELKGETIKDKIAYVKYLYTLNHNDLYKKIEKFYPHSSLLNISKLWYKELKLKEQFLVWNVILCDFIFNEDYKKPKINKYKYELINNYENNWDDQIDKTITFDDYIFDKHTKVKTSNTSVKKTTEYFAETSSIVIPEYPLVDEWFKWIYLKVRGVNAPIPLINEEDEEKEEEYEKENKKLFKVIKRMNLIDVINISLKLNLKMEDIKDMKLINLYNNIVKKYSTQNKISISEILKEY